MARVARLPAGASAGRKQAVEKILDAAERLLVQIGHARITTRKLAEEAKVNAGLIHYYFGSMEEVFLQVLDRFTERLVSRQRAMYRADRPFLEKWRQAWAFQEEDLDAGYPKIWMELQAMAWNNPDYQARVAEVNLEWRNTLRTAYAEALRTYGLEDRLPVDAIVSLVMTMAQGYMIERLSGIRDGHQAMLGFIDDWIVSLEKEASDARPRTKARRRRRA